MKHIKKFDNLINESRNPTVDTDWVQERLDEIDSTDAEKPKYFVGHIKSIPRDPRGQEKLLSRRQRPSHLGKLREWSFKACWTQQQVESHLQQLKKQGILDKKSQTVYAAGEVVIMSTTQFYKYLLHLSQNVWFGMQPIPDDILNEPISRRTWRYGAALSNVDLQ